MLIMVAYRFFSSKGFVLGSGRLWSFLLGRTTPGTGRSCIAALHHLPRRPLQWSRHTTFFHGRGPRGPLNGYDPRGDIRDIFSPCNPRRGKVLLPGKFRRPWTAGACRRIPGRTLWTRHLPLCKSPRGFYIPSTDLTLRTRTLAFWWCHGTRVLLGFFCFRILLLCF